MEIRIPKSVTRTYVQRLNASPDRVFPLLCPVLEAEWIEGWDPQFVLSRSGVAEPDCVFVTDATPHAAIWYITRHEPASGYVEMIKITPEVTACRMCIQLTGTRSGSDAEVTYSHTSLGPKGDEFIESFTEQYYAGFMSEWEARLNHYLNTGAALRLPGPPS